MIHNEVEKLLYIRLQSEFFVSLWLQFGNGSTCSISWVKSRNRPIVRPLVFPFWSRRKLLCRAKKSDQCLWCLSTMAECRTRPRQTQHSTELPTWGWIRVIIVIGWVKTYGTYDTYSQTKVWLYCSCTISRTICTSPKGVSTTAEATFL